jgi:hypothetical protein
LVVEETWTGRSYRLDYAYVLRDASNPERRGVLMTHVDLSSQPTWAPTNGYCHVASIAPGCRLVWTSGQVPITVDGTPASAGLRRPTLLQHPLADATVLVTPPPSGWRGVCWSRSATAPPYPWQGCPICRTGGRGRELAAGARQSYSGGVLGARRTAAL